MADRDKSIGARDAAAPPHALKKIMKVLGTAYTVHGDRVGYAIKVRNRKQSTLVCPIGLTGRHSAAALERWILDAGLDSVLSKVKVTEFGMVLRILAEDRKVTVVEERGLHRVVEGDQTLLAMAWDGHIRYFGERPTHEILLVGEALKREARAGSLESWLTAFVTVVARNPRLLVALCVSLSSAMRRALGEPAFTLGFVAPTSTAKSTFQLICSTLTGRPTVVQWNATNIGLQDWLADRPDQPACVEDLHKADKFEDIAQIVMTIGNSAGRIRSKRSHGGGHTTPIQTSLVASSEKTLASMASNASAGLLARFFEVFAGKHGMFDNLCGFENGGELAIALKRLSLANHGTVWPVWLNLLAKSWTRVEQWHSEKLSTLRDAIVTQAGGGEPDELTGRLVNHLAFAAFSGCVATELGLWPVKRKAIVAAFALVLHEHVGRAPPGRNALAASAIEAVRAYVEVNAGKFPPLSSANDPNRRSGIAGYTCEAKELGTLRLFIPALFRELFVDDFGDELYSVLRAADLLVTSGSRYNLYEKKVKVGDKRRSMFFIAVRDDIRYSGKSS